MIPTPKLLIIEDDMAYGAVLSRRMSRQGFECRHVSEPTDALLCARQWHPSHVLLDMKLEDSNGLKLLPPLRGSLPQATIVLLTGFASIATAVEAVKAGADNYLAKPADTRTLMAALMPGEAVPGDDAEPEEAPMNPRRLEWEHLQQVLSANEGNVSATARQLGMHRRTLQRKLAKKPA
ncbi:response regulator transcription factor [Shewanella sp. FJAT-52076]|uniref:response regulator transcription factor n=1 Tax=Shewanella sp. FJAT-52076 TaxID=2864202 RepID=UPI001C65D4FE|nr:response regulator [Shewanella sp. FJAT-52076]QYJ74936.1 response regulator [Shewanella sp. FJAT-52076]